ncbi:hypothetical protein ACFE04_009322 [Oxalis oulophora]
MGRGDDSFDRPIELSEANEELKALLIDTYDEEERGPFSNLCYLSFAVLKEAEALMANRAAMAKTARKRVLDSKLGTGGTEGSAAAGSAPSSPTGTGSSRPLLRSRTGSFCPNWSINAQDSIYHSSVIASELFLKGVLPKDVVVLAKEPDDVFLASYAKAHCVREAAVRVTKHQETISKLEEECAAMEDDMRKAVVERGLAVSKLEAKGLEVLKLGSDLQTAQEALERAQRQHGMSEEELKDLNSSWIVAGWNLCLEQVAKVYPKLDQGELMEPGERTEKEAAKEDDDAMDLALESAYKAISPNEVPPTPTFDASDSQEIATAPGCGLRRIVCHFEDLKSFIKELTISGDKV